MEIKPTVIIDTREQTPFVFENLPTTRDTLATGDYSLSGLTHLCSVERKNMSDMLACVTGERDRFKAELQRMRSYRFRMLVIEGDLELIEQGRIIDDKGFPQPWRSKVTAQSVMGSLAAWSAQFELPVLFAGSHATGGRFVEKYLYQVARCIVQEHGAAAAALTMPGASRVMSQGV